MEVLEAVNGLHDVHLREKCQKAITAVQRTIDLYGASNLAFSFNGGKDSTVLLHILRAACAQHAQHIQSSPSSASLNGLASMLTFFFDRSDDFCEIREFVRDMDARYGLHLQTMHGDFKAGVEHLVNDRGIKAIFLGTRRGDPNAGGQDEFCPSSTGWPPFMRINTILGWTYSDVWAFLKATQVPYCSLYDHGFTSLGSINNTRPNSALRKEDGSYAPAHLLYDIRMERSGRNSICEDVRSAPTGIALTVALLIIGDEILAGKIEETNSSFLCRELYAIGWRVVKVVCIRDEVDAIASEVRALSEAHDVVLTSGGLGPTPDDVTMAGVAEAFGHLLIRNQDLENRLRRYFGSNVTQSHLKMAEAPAGEVTAIDCLMDDGSQSPFPVLQCRNVYVLPGVPHLLRKKWLAVKGNLASIKGRLRPFRSVSLRLSTGDETVVAPALKRLSTQFEGSVGIGSYPVEGRQDGTGIILSLESKSSGQLEAARAALITDLPEGTILGEQRNSATL
ncbi:g13451 [Coccomyxa viridis]|uniref:FAD synthase n=1 Tax=Coccomyxa viridis TaxID=1274662 RepID=A0ABP1GFC3_9CHLO